MQNAQTLSVTTLSLPKGGGALNGMGESLNTAGPDGLASLSLPLPVSAGRGVAPSLSLTYSSGAGNGPFGMGWQCGVMSIGRRTQHGVPRYTEQDMFLSPSGEVMVVADEDGQPDSRQSDTLQGIRLSSMYTVTRYHPRQIQDFSKLEFWQPTGNAEGAPFWLMSTPDGQVHIFGKTAQARISHLPKGAKTAQIAQWLLEESVTPTGEHIYYQYKAEDDARCEEDEKEHHPNVGAQRYLYQVHYGNIIPQDSLFVLEEEIPSADSWVFHLVFDYGERSDSLDDIPPFTAVDAWPCRPDSFSRYGYGFELRTRRLCRQVLMYHRLQALAGEELKTEKPALVSRMILDYDPLGCATTLVAVRQVGHEPDGMPIATPPLEFDYARFEPDSLPDWQVFASLDNFTAQHPYQLVDLMGEGLPGVLYQDKGAWWYKAPQRKEGGGPNDVTYGQMMSLPAMPSLQGNVALMDINGDGQMDWVVTQPGVQGYYSRQPGGQWTPFTPLAALPVEYFHPRAQLADLMGAGLSDLVMIGPKSVRLYANRRNGFARGQDVPQPDGVILPMPNAHTLVAFSDMLGSGQQHLVAVSTQGVTCWPNLGHGRFGQPLAIPGFGPPTELFNPDSVFLADIDGSGTTDLIYALSDRLEIYLNESGNRFSKPLIVFLPDGVRFDNTCLLQIADIQGLGVASLVLTVPHMAPSHWRCDLMKDKPWLLNTINNNMGTHHVLRYRSSAQFWLDEKSTLAEGKTAACYLPFPIHCLWQTDTLDEITGNRLVATLSYAHGAWDGREREFRGFGYIEQRDTDELATGSASERTPPTLTKSWFATGLLAVDEALVEEYWRGDIDAFTGFTPRFTRWSNGEDDPFEPKDEQQTYWLQRGLKGQLLRSELYGLDDADNAQIPYTVSESRYQVRCLPTGGDIPVVLVSGIESRIYAYERIASDPQCTHSIQLESDAFGFPMRSVEIAYPRRPKPASSPYPSSLPASLFDDSYDDQQRRLCLTLQRNSWHHLTEKEDWVLGIANGQRNDAYDYAESAVPSGGLTLELLQKEDSLVADGKPRTYLGQQRVFYTDGKPDIVLDKPTVPVMVAFTESAVLDKMSLVAFDGVLTEADLRQALEQGGYVHSPRLFDDEGSAEQVWCARQGYTDYGSAAQFWRPMAQRNTLLTGKTVLDWDTHYCAVVAVTDAAGLTSQAEYDYRFLTPITLTDANDNRQAVTLDALGRVTSQRFWGTEAGQVSGYSTPQVRPFTPPTTVEAALALTPGIPVAQSFTVVADSWMPQFSEAQITSLQKNAEESWRSLIHHKVMTDRGQLCQLAYQRWVKRQPVSKRTLISLTALFRQPPHICLVTTDRYDSDDAQQLRQQVTFSDGFGRPLQTAIRHAPGLAYQRAEDGHLVADPVGAACVEETNTRWAVTGRVEHNNKGQPVRVYQPYYLNDWKYVSNDSARTELFADTHFYDPLGREYKVLTAKGDLRRYQAFPWFTVSEDENDTAADVKR
ncbi:Insecticidal toxin complex [Mycoavidus cysteinexigens]|uniref:Insecticidal toxin complex n=1 Tax=Mycoavidus cysteinexigens TaxID=1553431 RepID=A0A2Z6EY60_9BURK|nr:SpvB/TcaC N-terminal domain-containing protein [Mycoavidus cysteinexigens]BBE10381.1 Insecticidal toxin complex [Mycoavidus cysteinexigens]GAM53248.1 putative insecticidal toxin complex protein TccB [bacterium endosymbiont of Mortierella elongata FMR23-6]GLR00454.1 toxin [Mycoavidus cysteinexigens]